MDITHPGARTFTHFMRPPNIGTFKIFLTYFFIGIGLLFYWQGTWGCLALLYHFSPHLEVNVYIYISSSFTLFVLASFAPQIVGRLQPNNLFLLKDADKTVCDELNGVDLHPSGHRSGETIPDFADSSPAITYYSTSKGSMIVGNCKLGYSSAKASRRILHTLELKIGLYIFEVANVGSWFGPWGLIDYLGENYFQPLYIYLVIHVVITAILVSLGSLSLVVVTPYHSAFETDKQVNLFMPLLFNFEPPRKFCALLGRSIVRVFFLGNMVFLFWYSAWGLINLLAMQMLPAGFASLPVVMLPFVCLFLFIPNFFVLSYLADKVKHAIGRPLLAYIQGLFNVTFWIFGWNFSAWLFPFQNEEWEVAYPFLCHAVTFLALAACGVVINLGI